MRLPGIILYNTLSLLYSVIIIIMYVGEIFVWLIWGIAIYVSVLIIITAS